MDICLTRVSPPPPFNGHILPYLILVIFLYTTAIWGLEILQLKVRKFGARVASRQNSVNYHSRTQIMKCLKTMIWNLNCKSNNTLLCKIARWLKNYTVCKTAPSVKITFCLIQSSFFLLPCGKFYTWLKFFTQPTVVMVVTNMRYAQVFHVAHICVLLPFQLQICGLILADFVHIRERPKGLLHYWLSSQPSLQQPKETWENNQNL